MRYFKVMRGFGQDDFIPIDETELDIATYAHMTGKTAFLKNGSINGSHISAIMPDYHRAMGWRYGHKMKQDDWQELADRGVQRQYVGYLEGAKQRIREALAMNRPDLIGKHEELMKLT